MKTITIPIDRVGRIVLPNNVREELAIEPGDLLKVSIQGSSVTLTPDKEPTGLVRKNKALVFSTQGDEMVDHETSRHILEQGRAEREARGGTGLLRRKPA